MTEHEVLTSGLPDDIADDGVQLVHDAILGIARVKAWVEAQRQTAYQLRRFADYLDAIAEDAHTRIKRAAVRSQAD